MRKAATAFSRNIGGHNCSHDATHLRFLQAEQLLCSLRMRTSTIQKTPPRSPVKVLPAACYALIVLLRNVELNQFDPSVAPLRYENQDQRRTPIYGLPERTYASAAGTRACFSDNLKCALSMPRSTFSDISAGTCERTQASS